MNIRIIPRLDIKGPNLVKGVNFEGLRVLGKPEQFARHYYEAGADELIYMDAVASLYGRNSLLEIVRRTAEEIFIPLTVGGGLRSVEDIRKALRSGADKVAINTMAIQRPELIREASRAFGSSTILISIEASRKPDGTYEAYTEFGRQATGINAVEWAKRAVELGAGEIAVTSIDRDGTGQGFDLPLTRAISEAVSVPVIAAGGAGKKDHVREAVVEGQADAVCIASLLHYRHVRECKHDPADFSSEGNTESLEKGFRSSKIEDVGIPELKTWLSGVGVECRIAGSRMSR